ncbi:MAG: DUF4132 domain-containing protein [Gallionella sp.]
MIWLAFRNKWARPQARRWLTRYPAAAARGLIPVAFGSDAKMGSIAQRSLYWLAGQGYADIIHQETARYGTEASEALKLLLSISPLEVLPVTLPTLPKNLPLAGLPRLILKAGGRAIAVSHVSEVLMTLMLSKPDEPYVGLAEIQEAVTPESLANLGQALFKWWQNNGTTSKDRWMFGVQGLNGNDETARQLYMALRQWRAKINRTRSYEAMEMLVQLGSDVALMYLNALAEQTRFNDLQDRAKNMVNTVAEQRGLTLEQLADRTVPDLGLNQQGKLALSFGERQFILSFNETLLPRLEDSAGKLLKALPKPNSRDDEATANESIAIYKDIKKQVKSVAATQLKRLESAMCSQRRWEQDEFMTLFVHHPLLRHMTQALVWGVFDPHNQLLNACRIAEDLTLADVDDNRYELPEGARIGIVHRLELSEVLVEGFGQVLADYQIIQPFQQLARDIYLLPAENREHFDLPEWKDRQVTIASLMGLEQRGWDRGVVMAA